jgi:hypothetical protein
MHSLGIPRRTFGHLVSSSLARLINPLSNTWWHDSVSDEFIAGRICDPVEMDPVVITMTLTQPASASSPASPPELAAASQSEKPKSESENDANNDPDMPELVPADDSSPQAESKSTSSSASEPNDSTPAESKEKKQNEPIKVNVTLCNFVLPEWSNPHAREGTRVDFMGTLKRPFQVGIGGCCLKYESVSSITPRLTFDRQYPAWRRDLKRAQIAAQDAVSVAASKAP